MDVYLRGDICSFHFHCHVHLFYNNLFAVTDVETLGGMCDALAVQVKEVPVNVIVIVNVKVNVLNACCTLRFRADG